MGFNVNEPRDAQGRFTDGGTVGEHIDAHPKGAAHALRELAMAHKRGEITFEGTERETWTSTGAHGSVHVHKGDLPDDVSLAEASGDNEFETDQGHRGLYDVAYSGGDAHVGNVRILGENDEEAPAGEALNRVGMLHVRRHIADVEHGVLEERAWAAEWDRMSPQQQQAELDAQQQEQTRQDRAKMDEVHVAVDAAVARGWKPKLNVHGGLSALDIPKEVAAFASSPESQAKVKARLRHHGLF